MSPNTKKSTIIGIVILLLILGGFVIYQQQHSSVEMTGRIAALQGNTVTVIGTVSGQQKEIQFEIGSDTVLENHTYTVPFYMDLKPGQSFQLQEKTVAGQLSDLKKDTKVLKIQGKQSFLKRNTATLIQFVTYATPK
jgi:hypothetical protein